MIKKISLTIFSLFVLLTPALAFAQTKCPPQQPTELFNPLQGIGICGLVPFISWLVGVLSFFIGLIAVVAIVLAGYQMVTGGGDPEKLQAAKQRIFYAIAGLVITLLAYTVVKIVLNLIANKY